MRGTLSTFLENQFWKNLACLNRVDPVCKGKYIITGSYMVWNWTTLILENLLAWDKGRHLVSFLHNHFLFHSFLLLFSLLIFFLDSWVISCSCSWHMCSYLKYAWQIVQIVYFKTNADAPGQPKFHTIDIPLVYTRTRFAFKTAITYKASSTTLILVKEYTLLNSWKHADTYKS